MNNTSIYKDTNLDWIPSIPEYWDVIRSKFIFENKSVKNCPDEPLLSVTQKNGLVLRSDLETKVWNPTDDTSGYKLVESGDFVISLRSFEGGLELSRIRGLVSPAYTVLKSTKTIDLDYYRWLMKSQEFIVELNKNVTGIRQGKNIGWDDFGNIYLCSPPLEEQQLISRYLDKKTEQIDSLIEKIQKKIELLKEQRTSLINQCVTKGLEPNVEMKDSGIEWIGEIPKHWKKIRLKYLVTMNSGFAFKSSEYAEEGVQVIKIGNLYQNKLDLTRSPSYLDSGYLESHPDFVVRLGDLLISLTGTLGKRDYGFVCRYEQDNLSLLNQRVGRLVKNSPDIMDEFLKHSLTSESFLSQLFRRPTGTKQGNLSNDDVLLNYLWLPPIETQLEICSYLDSKLHDLDNSQRLYEIKIDLIGEYRQSLISSVVTGKVRVTEDMI